MLNIAEIGNVIVKTVKLGYKRIFFLSRSCLQYILQEITPAVLLALTQIVWYVKKPADWSKEILEQCFYVMC